MPLEELGLPQHLQEVGSSSSSRSSSPGLHDACHFGGLLEQQQQQHLAAPRPPITYLPIYEDSNVSLGIFCLPARAKIPLHNHPGMTVLSRCAYGWWGRRAALGCCFGLSALSDSKQRLWQACSVQVVGTLCCCIRCDRAVP